MLNKFFQLRHQGALNPFASMARMGGDSGSSGSNYYANQDKLLGVQADVAQNMYNEYASRSPGYLDSSQRLTNEAMDGTLGARARNNAANEANAAIGASTGDALRNLSKYGVAGDPSSARYNDMAVKAGLSSAAMRSGAQNNASQWAEDQKWNRNANAFGQIAGMGSGSMAGLSSAASGYGSMANSQNQAAQANAAGMGQFGGTVAAQMFKADGGYIEGEAVRVDDKPGLHMAKGKRAKKGVKLASGGMPKLNDWRQYPTTVQQSNEANPMMQVVAGAAPVVAGEGVKWAAKESGLTDAMKSGIDSIKGKVTDLTMSSGNPGYTGAEAFGTQGGATHAGSAQAIQDAAQFADEGSQLGQLAAQDAAFTEGTGALAEGTATALADGATAAAAETAAGSSLMSTVGTALPYVGLALAAGKAFGLFSEGGDVERDDMTAGGDVEGPGTETSDDIPAWLSDGEYVLNAEAVKMVGKKKLDQINKAGLERREGTKPGVKLAGGGAVAFDPEGGDYDYETATSNGMGPDGTGENQGHWGSVAPASAAERQTHALPDEAYKVLKGRNHPTFDKAVGGEEARGFKVIGMGGRYYSVPKDWTPKPGVKLASGGYLGVALGAGTQAFNQQQRLNEEKARHDEQMKMQRDQFEMQKAANTRAVEKENRIDSANKNAAKYMSEAQALAGLGDAATPEVVQIYRDAGMSPEALRAKAVSEMAGLDFTKGLALQENINKQQRQTRMDSAGSAMARGDVTGALNEANGGRWATTPGLEAVAVTGKDGSKSYKIGNQTIDERLLPGYLESVVDQSKGIEYMKEAGRIRDQDKDRELRAKQLGMTGAQLNIAQEKWGEELKDIKTKRDFDGKIRDLRTKLSETPEGADREKYKFQLQSLMGGEKGDQYRYEVKQYENDQGRKGLAKVDRFTGTVEEVAPTKPAAAPTKAGVKTVASRAEFDALPKGAAYDVLDANGKVVKTGVK